MHTDAQMYTNTVYMNSFFVSVGSEQDIIDEAIYYFKANVFFKSFEVKVCVVYSLLCE